MTLHNFHVLGSIAAALLLPPVFSRRVDLKRTVQKKISVASMDAPHHNLVSMSRGYCIDGCVDLTTWISSRSGARCCCDASKKTEKDARDAKSLRCKIFSSSLISQCSKVPKSDAPWAVGSLHHHTNTVLQKCMVPPEEVKDLYERHGTPKDYCTAINDKVTDTLLNGGEGRIKVDSAAIKESKSVQCSAGLVPVKPTTSCQYHDQTKGKFLPEPACKRDDKPWCEAVRTGRSIVVHPALLHQQREVYCDTGLLPVTSPVTCSLNKQFQPRPECKVVADWCVAEDWSPEEEASAQNLSQQSGPVAIPRGFRVEAAAYSQQREVKCHDSKYSVPSQGSQVVQCRSDRTFSPKPGCEQYKWEVFIAGYKFTWNSYIPVSGLTFHHSGTVICPPHDTALREGIWKTADASPELTRRKCKEMIFDGAGVMRVENPGKFGTLPEVEFRRAGFLYLPESTPSQVIVRIGQAAMLAGFVEGAYNLLNLNCNSLSIWSLKYMRGVMKEQNYPDADQTFDPQTLMGCPHTKGKNCFCPENHEVSKDTREWLESVDSKLPGKLGGWIPQADRVSGTGRVTGTVEEPVPSERHRPAEEGDVVIHSPRMAQI